MALYEVTCLNRECKHNEGGNCGYYGEMEVVTLSLGCNGECENFEHGEDKDGE